MNCITITVDVLDAEKTQIDLTDDGKLSFNAESHGQKYGFDLELFKGVVKAESGWNTKGRNVTFRLAKLDDDQEEYWPRLTKDKAKNQKIQIDWSKWVDEDEVDKAADLPDDDGMQGFGGDGGMPGMGGMDMEAMQKMMAGMGGKGGMGGMGGHHHDHDHDHDHDHGPDSDDEDEDE